MENRNRTALADQFFDIPVKKLRSMLATSFKRVIHGRLATVETVIPEITPGDVELIAKYRNFSLTSIERQWALISSTRYLNAARIEGDIVECGVWRGGSMMLAKELCSDSPIARRFYLYDTFAGMSEPTEDDVSHVERPAQETYQVTRRESHTDWAYASLEEVKDNFRRAHLLDDSVVFVQGKVEETLADPDKQPQRIALLRLDTDWYESTKMELEVLYPRLVPGGVLIIDDYGHWAGARKAVDEYFKDAPVLLNRIDYTGRLAVRT
ncbi:TylF/MycF/NovP-related O-methyltransferase [Mycobacterium sp. MMS18-G62]